MNEQTSYELYLEKYCADRNLTPEEGASHKIVQLVKNYYEENNL